MYRIVTCRRGGVSNKPPRAPGSNKTLGQGSFGPFTGGRRTGFNKALVQSGLHTLKYLDKANLITLPKNLKKEERTVHWTRFAKTGWTWHVTVYRSMYDQNYQQVCSSWQWLHKDQSHTTKHLHSTTIEQVKTWHGLRQLWWSGCVLVWSLSNLTTLLIHFNTYK